MELKHHASNDACCSDLEDRARVRGVGKDEGKKTGSSFRLIHVISVLPVYNLAAWPSELQRVAEHACCCANAEVGDGRSSEPSIGLQASGASADRLVLKWTLARI